MILAFCKALRILNDLLVALQVLGEAVDDGDFLHVLETEFQEQLVAAERFLDLHKLRAL